MKTDVLIARLSNDLAPVPQGAVGRTLALGLGLGAAVSCVLMLAGLGLRPDLASAVATFAFWMKFFYTALLAVAAFFVVARLARPGVSAARASAVILVPLAAIMGLALLQWQAAPVSEHRHILMGGSHEVCPWYIVALSLPVFAGVFWSLRKLAPTRLGAAGAAAGLLAGATGAWIYAFHCGENTAPFVAVWYSLGIALVGAAGAMAGRRLLRW